MREIGFDPNKMVRANALLHTRSHPTCGCNHANPSQSHMSPLNCMSRRTITRRPRWKHTASGCLDCWSDGCVMCCCLCSHCPDCLVQPLGKLKKDTILKAYKVLQDLSKIIVGAGGGGSSSGSASGGGGSTGCGGSSGFVRGSYTTAEKTQIMDLSNAFYSLIPHVSTDESGGTRARLLPIDDARLLQKKASIDPSLACCLPSINLLDLIAFPWRLPLSIYPVDTFTTTLQVEMVEALGNIEMSSRVIGTGKGSGFDLHPIDRKYLQLKNELTPVPRDSQNHKMLQEYITNTHGARSGPAAILYTFSVSVFTILPHPSFFFPSLPCLPALTPFSSHALPLPQLPHMPLTLSNCCKPSRPYGRMMIRPFAILATASCCGMAPGSPIGWVSFLVDCESRRQRRLSPATCLTRASVRPV